MGGGWGGRGDRKDQTGKYPQPRFSNPPLKALSPVPPYGKGRGQEHSDTARGSRVSGLFTASSSNPDLSTIHSVLHHPSLKKADNRGIDAFELWYSRRLLRVPWTARRSNQSILKEINPEYLLEGLKLKLKLQYSGHLMGRADSLEKTLMLGKIEGRRRG